MIKDKITPELKRRFIEDIKITKDVGKERGFYLCETKEEKLIPTKSCEGSSCDILLESPMKVCPSESKPFGDFHTHPYLIESKLELKKRGEQIPPDDELRIRFNKNIREVHEKITGVKGITVSTPSYTDILYALLYKSKDLTKGTVCTATDAEPDKVECWSIRDMDKDKLNIYATYGLKELNKMKPEGSMLIEKWIDNISEREIISL